MAGIDPPHDGNERLLVERASLGDRKAFEDLYRRHHGVVLAACRRWVGDPQLAEELTQDVFVKAYRHLASLRHTASMRPWLIRVAHNLCIDHGRAARVREVGFDDMLLVSSSFDTTSERAIARVSLQRLWRRVHPELARLDVRDRRLLWQRDVEGRSYRELARSEGETKHALRNRAFRARMVVRERVHLLREELDALSSVPPFAFLQRVYRRARERAGRLNNGFAGISFPVLSLSGCLSVVLGLAAPAQMLGAGVDVQSEPPNRVVALTVFPATGGARDYNPAVARTATDIPAHEPIAVSVDTKKRSGAAAPHETHADVVIRWPDGSPLYELYVDLDCGLTESDVLPVTGELHRYC